MNIIIRTDASIQIGTGHVMRCLTLAKQLQRRGATVTFICREFEGNSISYLRGQGVSVHSLPTISSNESDIYWMKTNWRTDVEETIMEIKELNVAVDLVIVDHYGLDSRWESHMRNVAKKIMVIDDLADRLHDCDLLLDQNYYFNIEERYKELVPAHCVQMLGPNFVLLRDEFIQMANKPRKRTGKVENILVFFGGTDPTGETIKALKAIKELDIREIKINVVVGASNPRRLEVEQLCSEIPNTNYHCQVSNMAELMWEADLSIGAGGATTWERCFLGLPTLVVVTAMNQYESTVNLAKADVIIYIGNSVDMEISDYNRELTKYLKKVIYPMNIIEVSTRTAEFVEIIIGGSRMSIVLRKIEEEDLEMIMNWRMLSEVTRYMYTDPKLNLEDQKNWFENINEERDKYWIIQLPNGKDVGLISVNNIDYENQTANWAYYLAEVEARGKGLAKILECNLYDFVFYELKINKIWYEVLEFNEMVVRLHKKFGGKIEGEFIDHIYKNNEFHNVIRMATFKADWTDLREKINYTRIQFC